VSPSGDVDRQHFITIVDDIIKIDLQDGMLHPLAAVHAVLEPWKSRIKS